MRRLRSLLLVAVLLFVAGCKRPPLPVINKNFLDDGGGGKEDKPRPKPAPTSDERPD